MSASLVGSEMCIRDRLRRAQESPGNLWRPVEISRELQKMPESSGGLRRVLESAREFKRVPESSEEIRTAPAPGSSG
eukprot:6996613-Alexandrium_andersonii.AAC.1